MPDNHKMMRRTLPRRLLDPTQAHLPGRGRTPSLVIQIEDWGMLAITPGKVMRSYFGVEVGGCRKGSPCMPYDETAQKSGLS